jgi:CubicO group peptidase (beta-lactamase class C family)
MNDPEARMSSPMVGFPPPPEARVTLANWQQPPWNRWSFLHLREVLPSANVSRGMGLTWVLPREPAELDDVEIGPVGGGQATLRQWIGNSWTDGLIVLKRGRTVFEWYRSGMRPEARHLVMSVSKSITSLLIGILVDQGQIAVETPVTTYAPELVGTAFEGATVQHLLDMEIATSWREDYGGPGSEYWRLDVACGWCPPRPGAAGALFDFMREMGPAGPHGETMLYSSPNTDLLAIIAERVTQTRFAELASSRLWAPMAAEFDADIMLDPAGSAVADGGFCIALRDMARIGQLFLERGRGVVPASWIEECERGNPEPFALGSYGADLPAASYHNQWWHFDGRTFALGIHGQMIAIDREADLVVGFMSTSPVASDPSVRDVQRSVVDALALALR